MTEATLAGLGEAGILARILPHFPSGPGTLVGPGDDAAVLEAPGRIVLTTDAMVQGHDFLLDASSGEQIGRKAAIQNLADVAAMGATPTWLTLSILAPSTTSVSLVDGIARGLADVAGSVGASVVGGDLGAADQLTVSITALGALAPGQAPVLRSGARPGDLLILGAPLLGMSAAGLDLILQEREAPPGHEALAERVRDWHLAPAPDISLGWRYASALTSLIDVSDGLVRDARRLAEASHVVIDLDADALGADARALEPLAEAWGTSAMSWVLGSGEEHAMLGTLSPATWQERSDLREHMRVIGRVLGPEPTGAPGVLLNSEGLGNVGFDHFEA
ncbi:MAG: thiamine-phosphate kinase [Dermabacter sp.]|nr:thiamine-phosphate kinase [Dermabacter sp.]